MRMLKKIKMTDNEEKLISACDAVMKMEANQQKKN